MANIYDLTDTWNDGAVNFTSIKMDVTDTASASGSNLIDLQVGGVSKFSVDKDGNLTASGTSAHELLTNNPHAVTAAQVGLSNVDNTSDADKPVSTLQAAAIATAQAWEDILSSNPTSFNTAVGEGALSDAFLTGTGNVATGYQSLYKNVDGARNVATGYQSLYANVSGDYNIATGYQNLYANISGEYNVATGHRALQENTSGVTNVALSREALRFNETGDYNVAAGYRALYQNVDGSNNVGLGRETLLNSNGSYNIALGYQSARYQPGGVLALTAADDSIFIGKLTKGVDAATNQIVIGDNANGLGSNTTVLGSAATTLTRLQGNVDTDGAYQKDGVTILDTDSTLFNTATGYQSSYSSLGGSYNTATGYQSLYNNVSGNSNVSSGFQTLYATTGSNNTASGNRALYSKATGGNNVASGYNAGRYISGGTVALTAADDSIFIGPTSKGVNSATNQIVIGADAEGLGSNTTVLGSAATTLTRLFGKLALGKDIATTPLHVYENNASSGSSNGVTIEQEGTGDSILQFLLTGSERWTMGADNDDGDKFKIEDGSGLTSAAAFTIDTSSNVGIGTASPGGLLHLFAGTATGAAAPIPAVGDNLVIEDSGDNFINLLTSVGDISGIYFSDASRGRGQVTYDHASDALRFATLTNERLRITSTGTVGIGTTTPNANAILDANSTTKAFLPPRMTTAQKNLVAAPTAGMVVYDTTLGKLAVHTGAGWEAVTSA